MQDQQESQELELHELFLEGCLRIADPDFNDPKLVELDALAPQDLLGVSGKTLFVNMIKYFNKQQERRTLVNDTPVQSLKRSIAAALKKTIAPVDTSGYLYFGVSGDHFVYQSQEAGPLVFNSNNGVVVKLLPRLGKPAQKYHVDQGAEDYV